MRGVAIVAVVAYHVGEVMTATFAGTPEVYRWFGFSLTFVRMPLFVAISGYVYALRPVVASQRGAFVRGKAKRLLVPFVVVGVGTWVVHGLIPGAPGGPLSEAWQPLVRPYLHMWFLGAMLLIFAATVALEALRAMDTPRGWGLTLLGSVVVCTGVMWRFWPAAKDSPIAWFNVIGAARLMPFFLLGLGLRRFAADAGRLRISTPLSRLCVAAVVLVGIVVQLAWYGSIDARLHPGTPVMMLGGLAVAILAFRWRRTLPVMAWVGNLAFPIYLLHALSVTLCVQFMPPERMSSHHVAFVAWVVVGVGLPIGINTLARRSSWGRMIIGAR